MKFMSTSFLPENTQLKPELQKRPIKLSQHAANRMHADNQWVADLQIEHFYGYIGFRKSSYYCRI